MTQKASYDLGHRFELAHSLARSVRYIHSAEIVHKNIRPETIVIFCDEGVSSLARPFLVGFEKFRLATGSTMHQGDELWERNLYRHPQRQGLRPEEDYSIHHDIYRSVYTHPLRVRQSEFMLVLGYTRLGRL